MARAAARSGELLTRRSAAAATLASRLARPAPRPRRSRTRRTAPASSLLPNTIGEGDCEVLLAELPPGSVDLIFTSPPYYNARPEYREFLSYADYLDKLRRVIRGCHRVLAEGRIFAINISPVLLRRESRGHASRRLAVPFDLHRLFVEEGFDFLDDIIWLKPEGAGWATGRGRRFAADRHPMQYKPVPITEYLLVYRRQTERLIDWHIRAHPDPEAVRRSRIPDGYERTNVWRLKPAASPEHPAVFPRELAEQVIRYYSFAGEVVLDPFAGSGTTGEAAAGLGRRFVLLEREPAYVELIRRASATWLSEAAGRVRDGCAAGGAECGESGADPIA